MYNNISPLFGIVVNTTHFKFEGDSMLAVTERFLNNRWIILYHITGGTFVPFSRYILFDAWNSLGRITKRHARIVDVGVSLEDQTHFLVVEQSYIRYLLVYFVQPNDVQLLKQYHMEPIIYDPTIGIVTLDYERYAAGVLQQESATADALTRISPINSIIVKRTMVTTLYERLAFVVETTPEYKWLFVYHWIPGGWQKQSQYEAIDPKNIQIEPNYENIIHIFQQYGDSNNHIIIVVETHLVTWWHTHTLTSGKYKHFKSHHTLKHRIINLQTV